MQKIAGYDLWQYVIREECKNLKIKKVKNVLYFFTKELASYFNKNGHLTIVNFCKIYKEDNTVKYELDPKLLKVMHKHLDYLKSLR